MEDHSSILVNWLQFALLTFHLGMGGGRLRRGVSSVITVARWSDERWGCMVQFSDGRRLAERKVRSRTPPLVWVGIPALRSDVDRKLCSNWARYWPDLHVLSEELELGSFQSGWWALKSPHKIEGALSKAANMWSRLSFALPLGAYRYWKSVTLGLEGLQKGLGTFLDHRSEEDLWI